MPKERSASAASSRPDATSSGNPQSSHANNNGNNSRSQSNNQSRANNQGHQPPNNNQQDPTSPNGPRIKKVFIQRDYSQGTGVRFQESFPSDLEGFVDHDTFTYLITNVNNMYGQGESMSGRAFCESCCACLSAYFLYLCVEPYYDKCARKVADFIEEQNDLKWKRKGLLVTDPLERGLRVIEITIFLDKVPHPPQAQPAANPPQRQQAGPRQGSVDRN